MISDLQTTCEELLAAAVAALDTIPASAPGLAGAPERSFVSPGQPAFDCCDQLTVHAAAALEAATSPGGLATGRRDAGMRENLVTLVVTITRCIHTIGNDGDFPTPAEMQGDATQMNADGWALWNYVWNLMRSGDLFSLCQAKYWDGLRAVNPSGGCSGWVLTLRVRLDGYETP